MLLGQRKKKHNTLSNLVKLLCLYFASGRKMKIEQKGGQGGKKNKSRAIREGKIVEKEV